jgi:hypothetical protein
MEVTVTYFRLLPWNLSRDTGHNHEELQFGTYDLWNTSQHYSLGQIDR